MRRRASPALRPFHVQHNSRLSLLSKLGFRYRNVPRAGASLFPFRAISGSQGHVNGAIGAVRNIGLLFHQLSVFDSGALGYFSFSFLYPVLCLPQVCSRARAMMSEYHPCPGSYAGPSYEKSIDAKIVIMGDTGSLPLSFCPGRSLHSPLSSPFFSSGVGKTALLNRYTRNKFDSTNATSTTGAVLDTKKVYKDGFRVRLQLWDTAGQERFRSMVCGLSIFTQVACSSNPHLFHAIHFSPPNI